MGIFERMLSTQSLMFLYILAGIIKNCLILQLHRNVIYSVAKYDKVLSGIAVSTDDLVKKLLHKSIILKL